MYQLASNAMIRRPMMVDTVVKVKVCENGATLSMPKPMVGKRKRRKVYATLERQGERRKSANIRKMHRK